MPTTRAVLHRVLLSLGIPKLLIVMYQSVSTPVLPSTRTVALGWLNGFNKQLNLCLINALV